MTRQELRVFFKDRLCGCGAPELVAGSLLRLLNLHPLYEHRGEFESWIPDEGVRYWLLYDLDRAGLTEHGTAITGSWLTDKGQAVRDALAGEEADGFEALLSHEVCGHGYDFDDDGHDCAAAEREAGRA